MICYKKIHHRKYALLNNIISIGVCGWRCYTIIWGILLAYFFSILSHMFIRAFLISSVSVWEICIIYLLVCVSIINHPGRTYILKIFRNRKNTKTCRNASWHGVWICYYMLLIINQGDCCVQAHKVWTKFDKITP